MAEHAEKKSLALDDFLSQQTKSDLIGTLEMVEDNAHRIKFTPWRLGSGCMCSASLELPKSAIASVTPTGDVHHCCGKVLRVAEIELSEETIKVRDLISQLIAKEGKGGHHHDDDRSVGSGIGFMSQPSTIHQHLSQPSAGNHIMHLSGHGGPTISSEHFGALTGNFQPRSGCFGGCGSQQCCTNQLWPFNSCCRPNCYTNPTPC